jgi:hypothetical protein
VGKERLAWGDASRVRLLNGCRDTERCIGNVIG